MRHLSLTAALVILAAGLPALDMGGMLEKATKAAENPGSLADAAKDKAGEELLKKLKKVQNEKGPIAFKTGSADLDSKKCLNTLKAIDGIIKKYPGFKVQIEGHTDNKGSADANKALSQKRAEAVVAWLTANLQTPADRMEAKGYGPDKPIADNKTEKGRGKNRRVDFSISKL